MRTVCCAGAGARSVARLNNRGRLKRTLPVSGYGSSALGPYTCGTVDPSGADRRYLATVLTIGSKKAPRHGRRRPLTPKNSSVQAQRAAGRSRKRRTIRALQVIGTRTALSSSRARDAGAHAAVPFFERVDDHLLFVDDLPCDLASGARLRIGAIVGAFGYARKHFAGRLASLLQNSANSDCSSTRLHMSIDYWRSLSRRPSGARRRYKAHPRGPIRVESRVGLRRLPVAN